MNGYNINIVVIYTVFSLKNMPNPYGIDCIQLWKRFGQNCGYHGNKKIP